MINIYHHQKVMLPFTSLGHKCIGYGWINAFYGLVTNFFFYIMKFSTQTFYCQHMLFDSL